MRIGKAKLAVIAWIVGLGLLAGALWALVLSPRIATAEELKQQSTQVELANITLLKTHQDILDMADQAPELALEAQRLFSRMPQSAQLPDVLRQINHAALQSGISSRNVQVINASIPKSLSAPDTTIATATAAQATGLGVNLATMTIEVTVSGTDSQRLAFLTRLQGLDRGLLINGNNAISEGLKARTGTLTVTGTMFVLESKLPDLVANAQAVIQRAQEDARGSAAPS